MGLSVEPGSILLGKYRIEAELGKGGMGVVVRARHMSLDEVVAIKLLAHNLSITTETFARFMREAQAAARLKSPHVVRVTDVGRLPDGMPYMVMEMLEGQDLGRVLKDAGPLGVPLATSLLVQVCDVLTEAHGQGIVHRDIKPSNLFLATDGPAPMVKVLDFGIAKAPDTNAQLTVTRSMLGTPSYMSPEQLRSARTVDHRTDIWALGVVLYELLEGRRPFTSESITELCVQIMMDPTPPMRRTPPQVAAIVERCLAKDPEARFQSAYDLALALAPFAGDPDTARREIDRMRQVRASAPVIRADPTPRPMGRLEPTLDATPGRDGHDPRVPTSTVDGRPTAPARQTPMPVEHGTTRYGHETPSASTDGVATVPERAAGAAAVQDPRVSSAVTVPRSTPSAAPRRRRLGVIIAVATVSIVAGVALAFQARGGGETSQGNGSAAVGVAAGSAGAEIEGSAARIEGAGSAVAVGSADVGLGSAVAAGSDEPSGSAAVAGIAAPSGSDAGSGSAAQGTTHIVRRGGHRPSHPAGGAKAGAGSAAKPAGAGSAQPCDAYRNRFGC